MANVFYYGSPGATAVNLTTAATGGGVTFTAGNLGSGKYLWGHIQVQISTHYVTYDGTTPTSTNGEIWTANQAGDFLAKDLLKMKFLSSSGAGNIFLQPCVYVDPGVAQALG